MAWYSLFLLKVPLNTSSSFLACNSRLRSAIRWHHPPQRATNLILFNEVVVSESGISVFQALCNCSAHIHCYLLYSSKAYTLAGLLIEFNCKKSCNVLIVNGQVCSLTGKTCFVVVDHLHYRCRWAVHWSLKQFYLIHAFVVDSSRPVRIVLSPCKLVRWWNRGTLYEHVVVITILWQQLLSLMTLSVLAHAVVKFHTVS